MAQRAGATITEVESSHMVILSHPQVVADVILNAIEHTSLDRTRGATVGAIS